MSALAAVALGAALLTAPPPPARPALAPEAPPQAETAPAPESGDLERLLREVRRIRERRQEAGATPAPAPESAAPPPTAGAAPAQAPLPPVRQLLDQLSELATQANGPIAAEAPPPVAVPERSRTGAGTAPGATPFPQRRPVWVPRKAETVGNRARPAAAEDLGHVESDAAGRDATPAREAPQMQPRPPTQKPQEQRQAAAPARLPVCRDPRIDGTMIPQIAHPSWPCGIARPVRVNAISGIRLSTPATLDCHTASRFATWVTGVLAPAARQHLGAGVETLWIMGSYACRRRNNRPSGKLSEHARGRAVDVGGFSLDDGRKVMLAGGWGNGAEGRVLAHARERACGLFHTVLGPGSDRHHHDHLHLDTSPRGGDPYCR